MSGTANRIQMQFLKRTGTSYSEYSGVPFATNLNLSSDVRQFAGAFDFELTVANGEVFVPKSHDAVEFLVDVDGKLNLIAVGFLEDFVDDSDAQHTSFKSNGRDLIGQLLQLPFIKHDIFKEQTLETFVLSTCLKDTYLVDYLRFRNRSNFTINQKAYDRAILTTTGNSVMRAGVIQNYADLAQNLVYQNPEGRVEIYGRQAASAGLGVLTVSQGISNVDSIRRADSFSKVISECTVEWTAAQDKVDRDKLNSNRVKNTDARVAHIYQPKTLVFAANDLASLAGKQDAAERVNSIAKAEVRKSMTNLGALTVVTSEPFYVDRKTGDKILFRKMQDWHIRDDVKKIDKVYRLAGIAYNQDPTQLKVQLAFVEPDTLV